MTKCAGTIYNREGGTRCNYRNLGVEAVPTTAHTITPETEMNRYWSNSRGDKFMSGIGGTYPVNNGDPQCDCDFDGEEEEKSHDVDMDTSIEF